MTTRVPSTGGTAFIGPCDAGDRPRADRRLSLATTALERVPVEGAARGPRR